jgi:hypothetical protein
MLLNNEAHAADRTQHFTVTNVNWFMMLEEVITLYSENNTRPINTLFGPNAE